jgi:hypothetical protein
MSVDARSHFLDPNASIHQITKQPIGKPSIQTRDDGMGIRAVAYCCIHRVRRAGHGFIRSNHVSSVRVHGPLRPSLTGAQPDEEEESRGKETKVKGVTEAGGVDQGGEAEEREGRWWHVCFEGGWVDRGSVCVDKDSGLRRMSLCI